MVAFFVGRI